MYQLATSRLKNRLLVRIIGLVELGLAWLYIQLGLGVGLVLGLKLRLDLSLVLFFRLDIASLHYMCMFVSSSVEIFRVA